jgi:hypothetical protein
MPIYVPERFSASARFGDRRSGQIPCTAMQLRSATLHTHGDHDDSNECRR